MYAGSRFIKAYRGFKWTDKLSMASLGEGDVFALFEEDGTRVTGDVGGKKIEVFRATSSPRQTGGIWGVDAEPYMEQVPELK